MARHVDHEELMYISMGVLADFLSSPSKAKDPDARAAARIASSALSSCATIIQGINNAEAIKLAAAKELSGENGAKFKQNMKQLGAGR